MKHSSRKNVDVHEKGRTSNNIFLKKVETTGKSKLSHLEQKNQLFLSVLQSRCCWQPLFYFSTHFSPMLLLCRNQSVDYLCKSMDWFLHNSKTVLKWVNINIFLILSLL